MREDRDIIGGGIDFPRKDARLELRGKIIRRGAEERPLRVQLITFFAIVFSKKQYCLA